MRAILTYHSIDEADTAISVAPACFKRHVEWLASGSVRVLSLPELLAASASESAVAITFDDALGSVGELAAPMLAAHGLSATVFVPTARVGKDNQWNTTGDPGIPCQRIMSWDEIGRLANKGWTIGAHTRHHPKLTMCDEARLLDELVGAADDIEAAIGQKPGTFAYPYGAVDSRVAAMAGDVFELSCGTELRALEGPVDRRILPRLDAYYLQAPGVLERWGSSSQRLYIAARRALRALKQRLR